MKIACLTILTISLVAHTAFAAAQSQNPDPAIEIKNPGIEEVDGEKPAGWNFVGRGGGTIALDEDRPFAGEKSAKLDSTTAPDVDQLFTNLMQVVDATGARKKKVRFRAAVRTADLSEGAKVQLWFRVDRKADANGQPQMGAFDNMQDRPINSAEWKHFDVVLPIAEDAERINVGMFLIGKGTAWIDDASLTVVDDKTPTSEMKVTQQGGGRPPMSPILQKAFADAENAPQQPFFTHWLWLPLIAIVLSVLAMLGPLPAPWPSSDKELAVAPADNIDFFRKFGLRFAVVYWGLYCLDDMVAAIPWIGMPLRAWHTQANSYVVHQVAHAFFGIEGDLVPPNGSGDTTYSYLTILVSFVVALAGASFWSLIDWRKTDYSYARDLLRSYLRYALALSMIGYGLAKVTFEHNQFPEISTYGGQLDKTWGNSSPMNVLWAFMGASRPYTIFAGLGEVAAAVLLIWRRTTVLGAAIAFGVMLNVMMLNYCYDVPVKIYSTHLVVMSVMIMLPEAPRLLNVFLLNRTAPSIPLSGVWGNGALSWLRAAVKLTVIIYLFGLPLGMQGWAISKQLVAETKAAENAPAAKKHRLTSRGYRWINETPFNR